MVSLLNVQYILAHYSYLGIFLIVFLESGIFFMLPGDSLLFAAGIFASGGVLSLASMIPLIFTATFLGGVAGYIIGVYIENLHRYQFFRKILKPEYILAAHKFFEKHGKYTVIISRFVPIIRTFVPIAAGIARMDRKKFTIYSLISSALWSTTVISLGYFLGKQFPAIENYLSYTVIAIVLISLIPLVFEWRKHRRERASQTSL